MRKVGFKRNTDPAAIGLISKGATEVKSMFGRKTFALEIRDEPKTKKQEQRQ